MIGVKFALGTGSPLRDSAFSSLGGIFSDCTLQHGDARHMRLYTFCESSAAKKQIYTIKLILITCI